MENFLGALLAVTLVAPFPETYSAFQNEVTVRGTVENWYSHKPISGALVSAYSDDYGVTTATADKRGQFFFLALLPGRYGFDAESPGYSYVCPIELLDAGWDLGAGFQYNVMIRLGRALTRNGVFARCLPGA